MVSPNILTQWNAVRLFEIKIFMDFLHYQLSILLESILRPSSSTANLAHVRWWLMQSLGQFLCKWALKVTCYY